jgi:glycosidase
MKRAFARVLAAGLYGLALVVPAALAQAPGQVPEHAQGPGQAPLAALRARLPEDEIIYFVLPDRFENGDPANDSGGLSGDRLQTGFDPSHKGFYHGGDFKGLAARLDYLQGLGVTAIWLTPVFRNKPVQGAPGQESSGFHGYWILDFEHVDPHLGSDADFRNLVDAAHARGMKVIMDIVANHTADVIHYRECPQSPCAYRSRADYPGQAYTPFVAAAEAHAKSPDWLNDPRWYHNRGDSTFEGESSQLGDFSGLDDLATEEPRVVQGFIDIFGGWIDRFGVDGFRIDTAKHVNPEFWQAFVPAMLARARARGIPNFHIFGEVATDEFDPALLAAHTRADGLPAVLDFDFPAAVRDALVSGNSRTLARAFEADVLFEGGVAAARRLPTFLGNHDQGRLAWRLHQLRPELTPAALLARVQLGQAMLLTLRGVPVIYYGDEQGFMGLGDDNAAREDMFATRVASYRDEARLGPAHAAEAASFDTTHPLYRQIAALAQLRREHAALRRGPQVARADSRSPGLFAVSRFDPESGREIVLAFNTSDQPLDARIEVAEASQHFESLSGTCAPDALAARSYAIHLDALAWAVCAAR